MRILGIVTALLLAVCGSLAAAAPLRESSLDRFVGEWTIAGVTQGEATTGRARGTWMFDSRFFLLDIEGPEGPDRYQAHVYFGEDGEGRLTVHWLDVTGGETARTLGTGRVDGYLVTLSFPYPDGEFRDRIEYDPASDRWRILATTGPEASPVVFADWTFTRAVEARH